MKSDINYISQPVITQINDYRGTFTKNRKYK